MNLEKEQTNRIETLRKLIAETLGCQDTDDAGYILLLEKLSALAPQNGSKVVQENGNTTTEVQPKEQELKKEFNNLFANEERYLFYTDADDPTEVECANEVFNFFTPHLATVEHDKKIKAEVIEDFKRLFGRGLPFHKVINALETKHLTQEGLVESEGLK